MHKKFIPSETKWHLRVRTESRLIALGRTVRTANAVSTKDSHIEPTQTEIQYSSDAILRDAIAMRCNSDASHHHYITALTHHSQNSLLFANKFISC